MAFTLAHPAAVVPLRRLPGLELLPLMVGSLTPDVIKYITFPWQWGIPTSHSFRGAVLVDLPVGLLLLAILWCLRRVLIAPLWSPHDEMTSKLINDFYTRRHCWLIAAPSLMIGIWSHLLWDRLTHEWHWTSSNLPLLYEPMFPEATHELPLYHFLQYATSIAGLAYLAWHYARAVRFEMGHNVSLLDIRNRQFMLLVVLLMVALAAGTVRMLASHIQFDSIYARLALLSRTALGCFCVLYLVAGTLMCLAKLNVRAPQS